MALIDVLRKKKRVPTAAPVTAGEVQQQAATGATGKTQVGSGPALSNIAGQQAAQTIQTEQQALATQGALAADAQATQLAEQEAAQDVQAQGQQIQREQALVDITAKEQMRGQQLQTEAEMKAAGLGAREQDYYTKLNNQYANTLANLASERGIVENDLFQDLSQQVDSLSDEKAASQLEQLAHTLALSDKTYLNEIEMIGAERNLRDELSFRREANQLVFGKNLEILNNRLDAERLMNMDARQFREEMARIDINTALEIANHAAKAQAAANIISGAVELGQAYAGKSGGTSDTEFRSDYGISEQGDTSGSFGGPR